MLERQVERGIFAEKAQSFFLVRVPMTTKGEGKEADLGREGNQNQTDDDKPRRGTGYRG